MGLKGLALFLISCLFVLSACKSAVPIVSGQEENSSTPPLDYSGNCLNTLQDQPVSCPPMFISADGGTAGTYSASINTCAWLNLAPDTGILSGTPNNSQVGSCSVTISMTDSNSHSYSVTKSIHVTNVIPSLMIVGGPFIILEDSGTVTVFNSGDVQSSEAGFGSFYLAAATNNACPGTANINSTTGAVQFTPPADYYTMGSCNVGVGFNDGNGGMVQMDVPLQITAVNDPPVISATCPTSGYTNAAYSCTPTGADVELSTLTWSFTLNTCGLSINNSTGVVSGNLPGSPGTCSFSIKANDGTLDSNILPTTVSIVLPVVAVLSISDGPSYDYGTVSVGSNIDKTFTVTNSGTATATGMVESGLAAPFAFKGGSYPGTGGTCGASLISSGTCTMVITFSPTFAGVHSDTINLDYFDSTAPQTATRALAGTAQAPIDQTDDDYGMNGFGGNMTLNNLQWNVDHIELTALGKTLGSGYLESRVMDAMSLVTWNNLSWIPKAPYGKDLPNTGGLEFGYSTSNVDMFQNKLLLHMDETLWNGTVNEVSDFSSYMNHGTAFFGADSMTPGRFNKTGFFSTDSSVVKIGYNDSDLDFTSTMSFDLWVRPSTNITANNDRAYTLLDKGSYSLGWLPGSGKLQFAVEKNSAPTWAASTGFASSVNINAMAFYNGYLYAAVTGSAGSNPDLKICTLAGDVCPDAWGLSWNHSGNFMGATALIVYKDKLYVGFGDIASTSHIFVCSNPANGGNTALCDNLADFTQVYTSTSGQMKITSFAIYKDKLYASVNGDSASAQILVCSDGNLDNICGAGEFVSSYTSGSTYESAFNLTVFNDKLYAAMGDTAGDGDILICSPGGDSICQQGEWSVSYNGSASMINALGSYNGVLYAGVEATSNQLLKCIPSASGSAHDCETADWSLAHNFGPTYDSVESIASYDGKLFVGTGWATGDGKIFTCDVTLGIYPDVCETGDMDAGYATTKNAISSFFVMNGIMYASTAGTSPTVISHSKNYTVLSTQNNWTSGTWYHLGGTFDGANLKLYINGVLSNSIAAPATMATNILPLHIGSKIGSTSDSYNSTVSFSGAIDEVAMYNTVLSPSDFMSRYQRGALNVKYQVRSCDDPICAGEVYTGPGGSISTYYSEEQNFTNGLPTSLSFTPGLTSNRYFQYKVILETIDNSMTPHLQSVTAGPAH